MIVAPILCTLAPTLLATKNLAEKMPWNTSLSTIPLHIYVVETFEIHVMIVARDTGTDVKILMNVYEYSYLVMSVPMWWATLCGGPILKYFDFRAVLFTHNRCILVGSV